MLKIKRHKLQVLHFRKIKFASIKEVQTCVKWYSRNSLKEIKNITMPSFWVFFCRGWGSQNFLKIIGVKDNKYERLK